MNLCVKFSSFHSISHIVLQKTSTSLFSLFGLDLNNYFHSGSVLKFYEEKGFEQEN